MNSLKVRTTHGRPGISTAFFLFVQVIAVMLMSIGRLASIDTPQLYNILYPIHADWDPWGSIYWVSPWIRYCHAGCLGYHDLPELKKEAPMRSLSFAAEIRPLFRSYDIDSMKEYKGINLSSYEEVGLTTRSGAKLEGANG